MNRLFKPLLHLFSASVLVAGNAYAEAYPQRPVTIIVPFAAGSGTDIFGRIVAEELGKKLGGSFIVDNKPGASGAIGSSAVARAKPDGYTLLITSSATHSAAPWLVNKISYDPKADFSHVTVLVEANYLLLVGETSPAKSLSEFVSYAASKGDRLTYGYGSPTSQVLFAAFADLLGIHAEGIPYKSQPQTLTDLVGGRLDVAVADVPAAQPFVEGKKVRPLVISTSTRLSAVPTVPTLAESGYRPLGISGWMGVAAPAGTPVEIVERLNAALKEIVNQENVSSRFLGMGLKPNYMSLDAVTAFVSSQLEAWGNYARKAGIKPE
ncbi:tripartite tricarboxylate transporter substrate binding protein [Pigmentiphaga sp. GD03639]|uniref:Bug family tripartite tricarboxylate transporter substrate binding protein n=1 Tax=Pigmentiphaga sp. GD03639 TaxID=2975354 RepID=UPI00244A6367|nr:tripartite tricarboxylate transporter substrate binding protein [Pigmentiphaga sp. GD03639]MDH2239460.1 tripartite tricarboxylate transporter substrate binding protein [Pigmentiphaga sp. GD03639]